MPCTTCDTYYDPSRGCDTPIRWLSPGAVCAGPSESPPGARLPQDPGVWCETCNCVVRVLICECLRKELLDGHPLDASWQEIVGNRGVCSRGGHDICLPTQQEITASNAVKLKALQKWRREVKEEVTELLRAHDANRAEIAKKILLYVGFDHPWKIY